MAWKLRQFFEGDRVLTVSGVADSAVCWVDGGGAYVANSIAIKIDGVETLLPTIAGLSFGFLTVNMPSGKYIGPTTTVQIYAKCVTDPNFTTLTLTSKSVNFQVTNGPILACSPQVALTSDIEEYVRLYVEDEAASFFNLKINGTNVALADFSYQSGDTGNIAVSGGNFSRPSVFGSPASLISNVYYGGTPLITITPLSLSYFTVRLGYVEIIFNGGTLLYNNYLINGEFNVNIGTYAINDSITIEATNSTYIAKKGGTVLFTKTKNISYTVTGGTVVPSSSQVGISVAWNLPTTVGSYDLIAIVGDSLSFKKTIQIHSCANAVDDNYSGTLNTPYVGNVSTNDTVCTGENSYFEVQGTPIGGTVSLNQTTGAFTFTPTTNFNGAASFQYRLRCGSTFGSSEIVDVATATINYFNPCAGVVANWVANGEVRCQNCTDEKLEVDLNSTCTGNSPRWVANPSGSACNRNPNRVDTGVTRCNNCLNEKEMKDLNPCSPTYQVANWFNGGNACYTTPEWLPTGNRSCVNCVEYRQERDFTECSPTYNTTREVLNPGGTACTTEATWEFINEYLCIDCIEYRKQEDTNPCSASFGNKRNVLNPNGTACNTLPNWVDANQTRCFEGDHQKLQINLNPCNSETERWVNTGLNLCGCTAEISIKAICNPDDLTTNPITAVEVYKRNTIEANRLVSISGGKIVFTAESEETDYNITIYRAQSARLLILFDNYKCPNTI